jgi:hypothetical protein
MFPRRFARVRPSGRVSSTAKIIVDSKTPAIDCTVIDYSVGGACLQIFAQLTIPDRFELLHGVSKKRCRVVWKNKNRIGVTF